MRFFAYRCSQNLINYYIMIFTDKKKSSIINIFYLGMINKQVFDLEFYGFFYI